jgi:hypothetical protein
MQGVLDLWIGGSRSTLYIQQFAVYIANLFFLTSDTHAVIIKDEELVDEDIGNVLPWPYEEDDAAV